jgi:hypothetical protein
VDHVALPRGSFCLVWDNKKSLVKSKPVTWEAYVVE